MRKSLRRRVSELLSVPSDDLPVTKGVWRTGGGSSKPFEIGDAHSLLKHAGWLLERIIDGTTFTSADDIARVAKAACENTLDVEADEDADYWDPAFKPSTNANYWEALTGQADGNDDRRELNLLADLTVFALAAGAGAQSATTLGAVVRTRNLRARGARDPALDEPEPPRFGLVAAQRARGRGGKIKRDSQGRQVAEQGGPHQRASAVLIALANARARVLYNPGSATLQPSHRDEELVATGRCERPLSVKAPGSYLAGHVAQVLHRVALVAADAPAVVFRAPTRGDLDETKFRYEAIGELRRLTPTVLDQADWADALARRFAERPRWVRARDGGSRVGDVVAVQIDEAIAGMPEGMRLHSSMVYESSRGELLDDRQQIIALAPDPLFPRAGSEAVEFRPGGWEHPNLKAFRLRGRFRRRDAPRGPELHGFIVAAAPAPRLVVVLDQKDPQTWPETKARNLLSALVVAFADRGIDAQMPGCFIDEGPPTPREPERRGVLGKGGTDPGIRETAIRLNSGFSSVLRPLVPPRRSEEPRKEATPSS